MPGFCFARTIQCCAGAVKATSPFHERRKIPYDVYDTEVFPRDLTSSDGGSFQHFYLGFEGERDHFVLRVLIP